MRGDMAVNIEAALAQLWQRAADSIPDWLPMRHIEWLPLAYEVAARFRGERGGRSHIYLVLLDYSDNRDEPHGVYVGMSRYLPAERFDQHKAGIRAAGSVLRRGVEVLTGPTHLRYAARRGRRNRENLPRRCGPSLFVRVIDAALKHVRFPFCPRGGG
jgi:hypothetical protein